MTKSNKLFGLVVKVIHAGRTLDGMEENEKIKKNI